MRDDNKLYREKRYVEVDVRFTPDGKIRPLAMRDTEQNGSATILSNTILWGAMERTFLILRLAG